MASTDDTRPRNPDQLPSNNLPGLTQHITGHDADGNAIIHSTHPAKWTNIQSPTHSYSVSYSVPYTISTPTPNLTNDTDLTLHSTLINSGQLGLVNPHGSVARIVDFAPNIPSIMHRTQSLDYGIVLEGEVEMILDNGVTRLMRRGDVAVQRGTNHGWRNVTPGGGWCRMFFVLQECEKVVIGGKELEEDLSSAGEAGAKH